MNENIVVNNKMETLSTFYLSLVLSNSLIYWEAGGYYFLKDQCSVCFPRGKTEVDMSYSAKKKKGDIIGRIKVVKSYGGCTPEIAKRPCGIPKDRWSPDTTESSRIC